jgi:hypothetical protein
MNESHLTRREWMKLGVMGAAGLAASNAGIAAPVIKKPAKAVIQIWMWGGPAHLDTFDPKPDAGRDYCGPFDQADFHQRGWHPDLRDAAIPRETGGQVFDHPQHDPWQQRP